MSSDNQEIIWFPRRRTRELISCPVDGGRALGTLTTFVRRSWIWRKNAMGIFQVEYVVRQVELITDLFNKNSCSLDLSIQRRMWCQAGRTVRNLLDIDIGRDTNRAKWLSVRTKVYRIGGEKPGIKTRSALIFFSDLNCLQSYYEYTVKYESPPKSAWGI